MIKSSQLKISKSNNQTVLGTDKPLVGSEYISIAMICDAMGHALCVIPCPGSVCACVHVSVCVCVCNKCRPDSARSEKIIWTIYI